MTATAGQKWRKDGDGGYVMPDRQAEYMEWLVDPLRSPATHKAWAADNGVAERTLRHWRQNENFKREWRRRAEQENVSPERTQKVIENMWRIAAESTGPAAVKAGELYLRYTQMFTPTSKVVVADDSVDKLSDEDLQRLLESA